MRHKPSHLIAFLGLLLPLYAAATPVLDITALSPTTIYLPAQGELDTFMQVQASATNVSITPSVNYWTSTEASGDPANFVIVQNSTSLLFTIINKSTSAPFICTRAFSYPTP